MFRKKPGIPPSDPLDDRAGGGGGGGGAGGAGVVAAAHRLDAALALQKGNTDDGRTTTSSDAAPEPINPKRSRSTPHCVERQLERGIKDSEVDAAMDHGSTDPSTMRKGCVRVLHTAGGVTVVSQKDKATDTLTAVTAWRLDSTGHPADAVVRSRVCNYGESDSDEEAESRQRRERVGTSWNGRPRANTWSCCDHRLLPAGTEDGCIQLSTVPPHNSGSSTSGKVERKKRRTEFYSERSELLRHAAEQRQAPPVHEQTDPNGGHRPWDNSTNDDASPDCNCGYADGVGYDWCECVDTMRGHHKYDEWRCSY
eukprot:gene25787-30487_t